MAADRNIIRTEGKGQSFLEKLAAEKRLPVEYLEPVVVDCGDYLVVRYYHADERIARPRIRHAAGETRFTWGTRRNIWWKDGLVEELEIVPYGLWLHRRLDARDCIVGEGESDGWACFFHDFAYLGIPGASNYRCLRLEHVARFERLFIHQEPDEAGARFAERLSAWLREIGYEGQIFIFNLGEFGVKDPSELHIADPQRFPERLQKALDGARPASPRKSASTPQRSRRQTYDRTGLESDLAGLNLDEIITRDIGPPDRTGKWCCPFHDDRSPSLNTFSGRDGKSRFKCFGCGTHGDAVDWVRARESVDFQTACERLGISKPATNGGTKMHFGLSGREEPLPDREECHFAPTKSGGNEFHDEHTDELRKQTRAHALQDCPNRRQVVIRKTEDLQVLEIGVRCKQLRCLYCRAKWISHRVDHYEEILRKHDGDLHFACVPAEIWPQIQRRLKREGAQYIMVKKHGNQRIVISDTNVVEGATLSADQAVRLISGVLHEVDETIKRPLSASAGWRHPSETSKSKNDYRLICRTTAARQELLRKCKERGIKVRESCWENLDIEVLELGIHPSWTDGDVCSFFIACEIEDFSLAIARMPDPSTKTPKVNADRPPVQLTFQFKGALGTKP